MKVEQTYQKYLQKVEKNITNDNISTDRSRFVLLFNESQNKFQEWILDKKGEDDIRYIQHLLEIDKVIPYLQKNLDHYDFPLPKNYFDLSNVYAKCTSGKCTNQIVRLFEIREEDKNELLQDEFNKPSFLWRESLYTVSSNQINVYFDEFIVDNIVLSYYRYPRKITLLNPFDPESTFDETQEIEFDDKTIDRIISICAGEFDTNNSDPRFQIQKQRIINKI